MTERKALIFCSASYTIDPKYNDLARDIVRLLHSKGYSIVSGGAIKGTMNIVSQESHNCGACHRGVIPEFMKGLEYPHLDEIVWTKTMSERKEAMREGTCLAIALPGGIGTMDEFFETFTLVKLGKYEGKVIVMNYDNYYDDLKRLLENFVKANTLDEKTMEDLAFPETIEELSEII